MLRKITDKAQKKYIRRRNRIRFHLKKNNSNKPRLTVFISNCHIYAQIIDDAKGLTLASASTVDKQIKGTLTKTSNKDAASVVGKLIADRLLAKGLKEVVFDRGASLFHGKVKALADAARESGLKF